LRSQLACAVVRAAVEVERTMSDPRFQLHRDKHQLLIARTGELAHYARRLGLLADEIANEDPLLPPTRVLEQLREVPYPESQSLPDARLVRLAAEVSQFAAVSSKLELYRRGMPAARALKLS